MQPNIFLIGPMGAGKTTVGRRMAQHRAMDFADSDHEIEQRTGVDIPFIFEKEGEDGFRRREREIVDELSKRSNLVLATGGGVVLDPDNRRHLAARGFVVYLCADLDQQVQRTKRTQHRPLLQVGDRAETLARLFEVRDPLYREIADLVLETHGGNPNTLVREIDRRLTEARSG